MMSEEKIRKLKRSLELEVPDKIYTKQDKEYSMWLTTQIFLLQRILEE